MWRIHEREAERSKQEVLLGAAEAAESLVFVVDTLAGIAALRITGDLMCLS